MPTKIVVALAALMAFGATTMTPALAAGHGGGGFHSAGSFGHMGIAHFGGGSHVGAYGRRFHTGAGFGVYSGVPYSTACSPYYLSYRPCY
jgi:hypothetical protein